MLKLSPVVMGGGTVSNPMKVALPPSEVRWSGYRVSKWEVVLNLTPRSAILTNKWLSLFTVCQYLLQSNATGNASSMN